MAKAKTQKQGFDPELDKCWIEWRQIHGLYEISLWSHRNPSPLGMLWGMCAGRGHTNEPQFSVVHAWTHESFRRRGIQRRLRRWVFEAWTGRDAIQRIITPGASATGGLESMRSMGYVKNKSADQWVLTRAVFFAKDKK